jgi:ankyrin repeat protein
VDAQDENGKAPLHLVHRYTPLKNVKRLVRAGARLDVQNKDGLTPLAQAVQSIRTTENGIVEYLLTKSGADIVNSVSRIHGSALHIACSLANKNLVRLLVGKGADVNLTVSSVAGTPLQSSILCLNKPSFAARGDDSDSAGGGNDDVAAIVDFLINSGADVSKVGGQFGTTVAATALNGSAPLLTSILDKGARPNVPDPMGRLPIHLASVHGADHFGILLDADGDVFIRDKVGRTALHWAAQGGLVSVVERILDIAGDDIVDQPDVNDWTALFWAARGCGTRFSPGSVEKQTEVIRKLLERGASLKHKSKEDLLPIDVARYHQADDEILELLEPEVKEKPKVNDEDKGKEEQKPPVRRLTEHDEAYCAYCLFVSPLSLLVTSNQ